MAQQESGVGEILKYGLLAVGAYLLYEYFFVGSSTAVATSTTIPTTAAAAASAAATGSVTVPAGGDTVQVHIDVPSSGQTVSSQTEFQGWYVDTTNAITAVQVLIDGVAVGNVFIAGSRTDVCQSNNYPNAIGCPNVGWSVTVNPATLQAGQHTLTVTAFSASGASGSATQSFNVSQPATVSQPQTTVGTPSTSVYPGYYVAPDNQTQLNAGLSGLRGLASLRKRSVKEIMSADLPGVDWVN